MFDINFFERTKKYKDGILGGDYGADRAMEIDEVFDRARAEKPLVYNIETTNYCNMTCQMCPRTTLMTRKNVWIDDDVFIKVIDQMKPHDPDDMEKFRQTAQVHFGVDPGDRTEDAFFFNVVSKSLVLHGYGEPLLDKRIVQRVQACTDRQIPTYFSCVPANITVKNGHAIMKAGLGTLKFSMDALDDDLMKKIRGKRNNFDAAFEVVCKLLELKKEKGYQTDFVITMIAMSEDDEAKEMHRRFLEIWEGMDVFAYVKSQDNRWYFEDDDELENYSHFSKQYCEYPWTSLSVMADGSVVPCTQDYDVEMVLGNVREQTLEEIWNGEKYRELRRMHITGEFPQGYKCSERCDLKLLHEFLGPRD
ncbi:MAG: SPASM domain-containing protein [Pirellulaceae bacterium]|jgi:radical SAM protein with 4Fe4S-binding SPASM domain|nr:SPASM domain-containing protein [Pirellulaceae bacterium]